MVPGSENTPLGRNGPWGNAGDRSPSRHSRLEDENRWLREAIARANQKNSELEARREAAEARSRLLEEENRRAQEVLQKSNRSSEPESCASGEERGSQPQAAAAAASPSPAALRRVVQADATTAAAAGPAHGDRPVVEAAEAHRNLVDRSQEVDRLLGDLLSRRGHLQAKLQSAAEVAIPTSVH